MITISTARKPPRVQVTVRDLDGPEAGRSKSMTIYGTDRRDVIDRLIEFYAGPPADGHRAKRRKAC